MLTRTPINVNTVNNIFLHYAKIAFISTNLLTNPVIGGMLHLKGDDREEVSCISATESCRQVRGAVWGAAEYITRAATYRLTVIFTAYRSETVAASARHSGRVNVTL